MTWLLIYACVGALVGFLAGLLGIGGGMTLVPVLAALFKLQGLAPDHTVHLALGTAMASVVFTSLSSAREHHRLGAVDWRVVRGMAPGLLLGALAATLASGMISQRVLALVFAVIVVGGATQILLGRKPSATRGLPGVPGLFAVGLVIGGICGMVSAGGAFLTVPFMQWCGVALRTTIGTAAALGLPVAVLGTVGYVLAGWSVPGLPPHTLGFVLLPALAALVVTSVLTAPIGARLTQRVPVPVLKRIFAVMLYLLALKMVISYL